MLQLLRVEVGHLLDSGTPRQDVHIVCFRDDDIGQAFALHNDILDVVTGGDAQEDIDIGCAEIRVKEAGVVAEFGKLQSQIKAEVRLANPAFATGYSDYPCHL